VVVYLLLFCCYPDLLLESESFDIEKMEQVKKGNGQVVIPGSRRPDGTYRKDIVVREGYVVSRFQD
jgi:hypothetical protein